MSGKTLSSAVLAASAVAAVLTACGDDSAAGRVDGTTTTGVSAPATPGTVETAAPAEAHNDADIAFAQQMIPHHQQAVMMAEMALSRSTDPQLLGLAERIRAAQEPEIATMSAWLRAWGVPVAGGGHGGHGGGSPMPGMMSDEHMAQLGAATGPEFDRMWLNGMIAHHEGAITMSRTELAEGAYPEAEAMAQQIIDGQQAEIDEMRAMLRE